MSREDECLEMTSFKKIFKKKHPLSKTGKFKPQFEAPSGTPACSVADSCLLGSRQAIPSTMHDFKVVYQGR